MFFFHDGTGILPAQQLRRHRQSVEPDDAHAISPQTLQPGAADRSARLARAEWPVRSLTGIPPYRPGPPERPDGDAAAGADVPGSWAGSWTADDGDPSVGEPFREISDGMAITPSVSVVLPVMNEAANLPHVFARLPALDRRGRARGRPVHGRHNRRGARSCVRTSRRPAGRGRQGQCPGRRIRGRAPATSSSCSTLTDRPTGGDPRVRRSADDRRRLRQGVAIQQRRAER